jgi:hypothetical protein
LTCIGFDNDELLFAAFVCKEMQDVTFFLQPTGVGIEPPRSIAAQTGQFQMVSVMVLSLSFIEFQYHSKG